MVYDHIIYSQLKNGTIYTHQYWDYVLPIPAVYDHPKILIIGLGGGTMPYQMNKIFGEKASIDVVELNKEMVSLSKKFLPEEIQANIIIGDGYSYLEGKSQEYDIIISDPYIGGAIPDSFFESRFVENVSKALKEDGILAINYILTINSLSKKPSLTRQLRKYFKVYTVRYQYSAGNVILICSKSLDITEIKKRISENFPKSNENRFLLEAYSKTR